MLARWAAAGASAVMAAIVLLHAGLTPGGSWDGDEYYNFALERVLGWRYVWHRLYAVSPRPLSEAVLWLYDGAVTAVGAPLVAPFLLLLWTVLVAGAVLALWRPGDPGKAWRVAAALGLVAMFLLGHAVREMFYWPFGAAPYLLAMTGIVVVTFRLIAGPVRTRRDRTICALALLVAAGSSETGQFFVVGCTATLAVTALPGWFAASAGDARQAPWYLLPLLAALALLGVMLTFRVPGATAGLTADPTYFHRFLPSVHEALGTLPAELFGRDPYYPAPGSRQIIVADVLLFLGLTGCLRAGLAGTPPPAPATTGARERGGGLRRRQPGRCLLPIRHAVLPAPPHLPALPRRGADRRAGAICRSAEPPFGVGPAVEPGRTRLPGGCCKHLIDGAPACRRGRLPPVGRRCARDASQLGGAARSGADDAVPFAGPRRGDRRLRVAAGADDVRLGEIVVSGRRAAVFRQVRRRRGGDPGLGPDFGNVSGQAVNPFAPRPLDRAVRLL